MTLGGAAALLAQVRPPSAREALHNGHVGREYGPRQLIRPAAYGVSRRASVLVSFHLHTVDSEEVLSMAVALRMSSLYAPTLKEDPAEAELASHRLLLRAGMIRKNAAGIYSFLPLGWRSLHKIEQIVREEMDAIGSQELLMPAMQPAELWLESGRWDVYGPELVRLNDRHGRDFCLGPTHEELVTSLVRNEVRSYRELPLSLYQIQVKFRDEVRPRFGLLRGREFIMKDAYSFHATTESLQEHYDAMSRAYARICERCGLDYREVEADSGQIGGKVTKEFMAHRRERRGRARLLRLRLGRRRRGRIDRRSALARSHRAPPDGARAHARHPHDRRARCSSSASPTTTRSRRWRARRPRADSCTSWSPATANSIPSRPAGPCPTSSCSKRPTSRRSGSPRGRSARSIRRRHRCMIADESLRDDVAWGVGANENDYHLLFAQPGRDFEVGQWADLVLAQAGDGCPECGGVLQGARGIEVSQVFQLGTKYSESMGATFADENGDEQPFIMGCYGVGVSRTLAAVIEQHSDESGIIWPVSVAPLEVAVLPLMADGEVAEVAERLWGELAEAGVETVIDDRDERAGVKFNDADLVGWPFQLVVGKRGLAEGVVELKVRETGERLQVPLEGASATVVDLVAGRRREYAHLKG